MVGRWLGAIGIALLVAGCSSSGHASSAPSKDLRPQLTAEGRLVIIMRSDATDAQIAAIRTQLRNDRHVRSYRMLARQEASKEWKQLFPRSTLVAAPPLSLLFDVHLRTGTASDKEVLTYGSAPGLGVVASGKIARSACPPGEEADNGGGCSKSEVGGGAAVPSTTP
jgi:FtsX-like permease family protein